MQPCIFFFIKTHKSIPMFFEHRREYPSWVSDVRDTLPLSLVSTDSVPSERRLPLSESGVPGRPGPDHAAPPRRDPGEEEEEVEEDDEGA